MIDFSGRTTRAGTRGLAVAAAVASLTVTPLAYHTAANAEGPVRHDHKPATREDDRHPAAREHGRHQTHEHAIPRTRIILDARSPRGPVTPGGTYQWPYRVTNTGTGPARDVALTTRPDPKLKVVATPPKCRWTGHDQLICHIGLIPGGETRKGAITATVAKNAPAGHSLSNPTRLSWNGRPAREARYSGFPPVPVAPVPATDLAVTSTFPEAVSRSGNIPYEVSVTNQGSVTAEGVVVRSAVADQPPGSPCAVLLAPAGSLAGKVAAIKPALPPCGDTKDKAAPACGAVPGPRADQPVILPCAVQQEGPGKAAEAAAPPCAAAHPASEVPPCAAQQGQQPVVPPCAAAHPASEVPPCAAQQGQQPVVPPCAAQDKPLVHQDADHPAAGPCAASSAGTAEGPGKSVPIKPQSGQVVPGEHPRAVPPGGDVPVVIGPGHHRCVSQGAGFVCPIGSVPPGKTRTLRLAVRGRPNVPHRLRCLSSVVSGTPDRNPANNSVDCHTRAARPMEPHRNLAVRELPHTGFAYGLLGLCGAGLAGVGFVLYRMGRTRRGQEG